MYALRLLQLARFFFFFAVFVDTVFTVTDKVSFLPAQMSNTSLPAKQEIIQTCIILINRSLSKLEILF